jgi:hypothetical protein
MKVIQYIRSPINRDYGECMNQFIHALPGHISYELYTETPYDLKDIEDYRFNSDLVRLKMAVNNPDMVWVDADTKFVKWFSPPDDGRPWFYGLQGRADICVFYVNNCCSYFKWLLEEFGKLKNPKVGWCQGLMMNSDNSRFKLIPNNHFHHLALGSRKKR